MKSKKPYSVLGKRFNVAEIIIMVVVALGLIYGGISAATPSIKAWWHYRNACSTSDGEKVYGLLYDYLYQWEDESKLANQTGRISLSPRIAELQRIRREVDQEEWPECAKDAKTILVAGMDYSIDGFIAFLQSSGSEEIDKLVTGVYFTNAENRFDAFKEEIEKVNPKLKKKN